VDGTGSGSCPMTGFGISGVEPSGSATTMLVTAHFKLVPYMKLNLLLNIHSYVAQGSSNKLHTRSKIYIYIYLINNDNFNLKTV
jgi:hypothetical protein